MHDSLDHLFHLPQETTAHPERANTLHAIEVACVTAGVVATIVERGLMQVTALQHWELGILAIVLMFWATLSLGIRWKWSFSRVEFWHRFRAAVLISGTWLILCLVLAVFGGLIEPPDQLYQRGEYIVGLTEALLAVRAVAAIGVATRRAAAGGWNPALVLVGSFLILIALGTFLLMLPNSCSPSAAALPFADRFRIALFTSTSASCVTGLIVVPTGGPDAYWTRTGQTVILCLFQIGGLGIMTCGAFFAVLVGSKLPIRESAALSELLESRATGHLNRLLVSILGFTMAAELAGAVLLSGLWSDYPLSEQIYFSVFHSVSAFCNAGFSLHPDSFVGMGQRWQVWGVAASLIIMGGIGFVVLYNAALVGLSQFQVLRTDPLFGISRVRTRLTLASKLVLTTTLGLLLAGMAGYFLLESFGGTREQPLVDQISEAWFQSVTFRTAGFNTVDHAELQPGTKLMAVLLMFIGASPGSTGGGVKTVAFMLAVAAMLSILRGRDRVEFFGRTVPNSQINRALVIIMLGLTTAMATTLLLTVFENQPDKFLDHLYEATSACGTVGVSTGITGALTVPSQYVLMIAMFLGRLGPLTVLLAMTGGREELGYEYPPEHVVLG